MESLDFRAARCLRSHLDQTIHFRVRDTKARQGKGWAQGHTAGKGQSQNRKLQFLVPGSRVPTSIPARQFTTEDFVWREKVPFRLRNLFPSQEQFMLKQHGGRTCWKNYEMMQRAREQAAHHLEWAPNVWTSSWPVGLHRHGQLCVSLCLISLYTLVDSERCADVLNCDRYI